MVTEQGEGLNDSIFDSDDQLFGEDRQVAHYFRFNEIRTGRTYGPHDTPDAPPTGTEIDVRWEDAYRIDPNASVAGYAGYRDKAVYDHAVAFNDAYAELLAHLEIAFNGVPRFMILGVPAMLRLRDLAERLYHNPHPDPDKGSRGYFASATFEIDHGQIECGHEVVSARVHTASLNAGEPVDLSAVEPPDALTPSSSFADRPSSKNAPIKQERPYKPRKSTAHEPAELGCTYRDTEDRRRSIHSPSHDVGANLLSFWRWACSDLVGNVMRGVLAEYIVGSSGWRWDVSTVAYVLSGTPPTFAPPRTVGWR